MTKIKLVVIALIAVLCFGFVVSCDDSKAVEEKTTSYSTPTIKGTVSLPSGTSATLGSIWVKIGETGQVAKTDSNGSFVISGLDKDSQYTLYFSDTQPSSLVTKALGAEDEKDNGIGLKIDCIKPQTGDGFDTGIVNLLFNGTVKGNVKLNGAEEGANYGIDVYIPGTSFIAKTSDDGSFTIKGVPQGVGYTIRYEKAGYTSSLSSEFSLISPNPLDKPEVVLEDAVLYSAYGAVSGIAKMDDESNHAGIIINLERTDGVGNHTGTTNSTGNFSFSNITPGTYRLSFSYSDYLPVVSLNFEVSASKTTILEEEYVLIKNAGTISGSVYTQDKTPLQGVSVLISNETNSYVAVTDASGNFSKFVKPGTYTVSYSIVGYGSEEKNGVVVQANGKAEQGEVVLINKYGEVSGKSYSANEQVSASLDGVPKAVTVSSESGLYELSNLEAGTYTITFSKAGYVSYSVSDCVVAAGASTTVDGSELTVASGIVTGKVVLSGEKESSGATVRITSTKDSTITYADTTAIDGTFIIKNVDKGEYTLSVTKDGFVSNVGKIVNVNLGVTNYLDTITLKNEKVTVSGSVMLQDAATYEGIMVLLSNKVDGGKTYNTTTDEKGRYTISDVVPGTYKIIASKGGFTTETTDYFTIESSVNKNVDSILLSVAIRSMVGKVTLEESSDNAGALITATNVSNPQTIYSAISNSSGDFTLAGMVAGEYMVSITKSGYRTETLSAINVLKDNKKDVGTIKLNIARGYIQGYVKLEGRTDHSGTTVLLRSRGETTTTDEQGFYSFYVPASNYPNGLSFTHEDFEATEDNNTITVLVDSTYALSKIPEMKATAVPVVKGYVDVKGTTDNSKATVSIEGTDFTYTTDENGYFEFEHIRVGTYRLKLTRSNTPTVYVPFNVVASSEIDLGSVSMIPNSATLTGKATLKSLNSYKGITVTVTSNDGKEVLTTTTDEAGFFSVSNVLSSVNHTVTFSKEGWDSQSITVSNLTALEERDITKDNAIELLDTTVPVLSSVIINSGAPTAADKNVTVHLSVDEKGSGAYQMQVANSKDAFNYTIAKQDYKADFDWVLESGNGSKSVFVRVYDTYGNASEIVSATVTLTDQKKEVKGVLSGDDLHWTVENSPYLVTGNISVESSDTLIIDPGVEVQFAGDFSIQVLGTLSAVGTADKKIYFRSEDVSSKWSGFKFMGSPISYSTEYYHSSLKAGSRISNAVITNVKNAIAGSVFVDNSEITASGYVLTSDTYASGSATIFSNSTLNGCINNSDLTVLEDSNVSSSSCIYVRSTYNSTISCTNGTVRIDKVAINNNVKAKEVFLKGEIRENTIEAKGAIYFYSNLYYSSSDGFVICSNNNYYASKYYVNNGTVEHFSSFDGDNYIIENISSVTSTSSDSSTFADMRFNYWGDKNTNELNQMGDTRKKLSFIEDYYSDFSKGKVVVDGYATTQFASVGYKENLIDFSFTADVRKEKELTDSGFANKGTTISNIVLTNLSSNEITGFRVAFSLDKLKTAQWHAITETSVTISIEDTDYDADTLLIQVKDKDGKESVIRSLNCFKWHVIFGTYDSSSIDWICLEEKDGKALLLSRYLLCYKSYNDIRTNVTWETCTLRTWLNGDFYSASFTVAEKSKIVQAEVLNRDNTSYGTSGGNNTIDNVFLLSIDEARSYFASNAERIACFRNQNSGAYWWLRSPGDGRDDAAEVDGNGNVGGYGYYVDVASGIRPALWVNL